MFIPYIQLISWSVLLMHSVRRHELGAAVRPNVPAAAWMHSVRRHELGVDNVVQIVPRGRCIPCGDMSWEQVFVCTSWLCGRCIPCGDMSWETPTSRIQRASRQMHSVRRHELGVACHQCPFACRRMHSVRRHELGDAGGLTAPVPAGDAFRAET